MNSVPRMFFDRRLSHMVYYNQTGPVNNVWNPLCGTTRTYTSNGGQSITATEIYAEFPIVVLPARKYHLHEEARQWLIANLTPGEFKISQTVPSYIREVVFKHEEYALLFYMYVTTLYAEDTNA